MGGSLMLMADSLFSICMGHVLYSGATLGTGKQEKLKSSLRSLALLWFGGKERPTRMRDTWPKCSANLSFMSFCKSGVTSGGV